MKKFLISLAALVAFVGLANACDYGNVRSLILQNNVGYGGCGVQTAQFAQQSFGYTGGFQNVQFQRQNFGYGGVQNVQFLRQNIGYGGYGAQFQSQRFGFSAPIQQRVIIQRQRSFRLGISIGY
mgnify:CR=1 FL=1